MLCRTDQGNPGTISLCPRFPFSLGAKLEKQKLPWAQSPRASYFNMALQPFSTPSQQEGPKGAFPKAPLWCHPGTAWPHRYPYSCDTASGPHGDKKSLLVTFSCFEHYSSDKEENPKLKKRAPVIILWAEDAKTSACALQGRDSAAPNHWLSRYCRTDPAMVTRDQSVRQEVHTQVGICCGWTQESVKSLQKKCCFLRKSYYLFCLPLTQVTRGWTIHM